VVEQAARVPNSRGRARELLRNSLRSFPDPDPVPKDAAWPPLRCGQTARSADRPSGREPRGAEGEPWWPEEPTWTRGFLSPNGRSAVQ